MPYQQITIEEYPEEYETTINEDPCKDCTNRTCEWSTCSYSNN